MNTQPKTRTLNTNNTPDLNQVQEIITYFPIGDRIDYYPEYQDSMTMQSVVLGYEINGHMIHSQRQLEIGTSPNGNSQITLHIDDRQLRYPNITSFCIILPGNAGEEYKLNYLSKASLGSRGQFRNGNAITLIARQAEHGLIIIETTVNESVLAREGFYRGHQLSLLQVQTATLDFREQRTHHRIQTHIPVKLQTALEQPGHACMMQDYSELHTQILLNEDDELNKTLEVGSEVTLTIKLEQVRRSFIIACEVMRKSDNTLILHMQKVLNNGQFEAFELMDALNLKASLIQHPSTR